MLFLQFAPASRVLAQEGEVLSIEMEEAALEITVESTDIEAATPRLVAEVADAEPAVLWDALVTENPEGASRPHSVLIPRRAAAACGRLYNERRMDDAKRLAVRALEFLAPLKEESPIDQVERLYWEAWLRAEILDDRATALALIDLAAELVPEDARIVDVRQRWTNAPRPSES